MNLARYGGILALGVSLSALAADPPNVKLSEVHFGKPISGEFDANSLKGKPTVVVLWVPAHKANVQAMPKVADWMKEVPAYGVEVVVGANSGANDECMLAAAKLFGLPNSALKLATTQAKLPPGTPSVLLFDADGKCVAGGTVAEVEPKLHEVIGKQLARSAGKDTPAKSVAATLALLKKTATPADVLKKLLPLQQSPDAATAADAKEFVKAYDEAAQKLLTAAESLKADDPIAGLDRLTRITTHFKGTPTATKAATLSAEWKKDKAIVLELKAVPQLETLRKQNAALLSNPLVDARKDTWQAMNKAALDQLGQLIKTIKKQYPDTAAAKEAQAVQEIYGLTPK
jgi:hypothetical protein